jgi:hypothetical protein
MQTFKIAFLVVAAAGLAGCNRRAVTSAPVSVSAGASPTSSAAAPSASPSPLPAGIELTSLDVAVQELELGDGSCGASASASSAEAGSSDASGDDCEVEVGPFVAHLDAAALAGLAAGKVPQVWTATVPAGTYPELEARICAIDPSSLADESQAALAAAMGGASVVLRGTYQAPGSEAAPVPFAISVSACAEIERDVNVSVDATGAISNLTIQVDVGAWFLDASGAFIPPDTAAGAAAIAARIAASLDMFRDDDHDGRSDG